MEILWIGLLVSAVLAGTIYWIVKTLAEDTKKFIFLPCDYPLPDHKLWRSNLSGLFEVALIEGHLEDAVPMHLYVTSENKIKNGDWLYNPEFAGGLKNGINGVFECTDEEWVKLVRRTERGKGIKRIEATSDSLLTGVLLLTNEQLLEWVENTPTGDSATLAYIAMTSSMTR